MLLCPSHCCDLPDLLNLIAIESWQLAALFSRAAEESLLYGVV